LAYQMNGRHVALLGWGTGLHFAG